MPTYKVKLITFQSSCFKCIQITGVCLQYIHLFFPVCSVGEKKDIQIQVIKNVGRFSINREGWGWWSDQWNIKLLPFRCDVAQTEPKCHSYVIIYHNN